MATHLNPVQWENPLSLDRHHLLELRSPPSLNSSFLHSQKLRASLTESRKAFLLSISNDEEAETENIEPEPVKKTPVKKISFKIKKTSSLYRRNAQANPKMTTISASKVAELTMKFNGLIDEKNIDDHKFKKRVRRVNSQRSLDSDRVTRKSSVRNVVTRKPSVKTKPIFDDKEIVIVKRKPVIKRSAKSDEQDRPNTLPLDDKIEIAEKPSPTGTVRAAIESFERRNSNPVPKPKVPEKPPKFKKTEEEQVQINIPQRRCDSMYETLNPKLTPPQTLKVTKSEEAIVKPTPNTSFLWSINQDKSPSASNDDWRDLYDFVDPTPHVPPRLSPNQRPPTLPKKAFKKPQPEEKIYEELNVSKDEDCVSHSYEYCEDDGYEICAKENIYETLPPPLLPRRQQTEPLPPRPPSRNSYCTIQNGESVSNCYESIYNPESKSVDVESTYESIYIREGGSNRDSLISSDQQSNSLYGRAWGEDGTNPYSGKATSDLSTSDRSDDWVDVTDNEENDNNNSEIIIIRERQKLKKTTGWSQQLREQWSKQKPKDHGTDSDPDHFYESLCTSSKEENPDDDYDSFDSDSDSDSSFTKVNSNDSGLDIGNNQLPDPPNNQTYVLTRFAATVKRKLRRNWSLTKNDISKSLSRMTKRKSREFDKDKHRKSSPEILPSEETNCECPQEQPETKSLPRKSFLTKFRRSMSLSAESANELTSNLDNKPKSTFYLTEEIDIDKNESERDSGASLSPVQRNSKVIMRPQSPPPPAPVNKGKKDKRSTSWYAEVGLFKNSENAPRRSNTFWYAEVGLYQSSRSTPSTSSAENSGNTTNLSIKPDDFINQDNNEEYYNLKNESEYYNDSINSFSSTETKKDSSLNLSPDMHLRLEDEPLYQFYDAAVLESVCQDGTSDFDSDGYEEVGDSNSESTLSSRPSAMELVAPGKHSLSLSRTLWCEIPEVIQSSVLSTLSSHQKKIQEAKFEMMTSEASYLNSLNVLHNHFIKNFENKTDILTREEFDMLFGQVEAVKNCSEKLIHDLEKCWQDNILLHGVVDIVQKHSEENFHVYVSYCETQILLDDTLRRLKEKPAFVEQLKHLEASSTCQSLTLYSFLMLPMQRITRWPLLVDAVLKRLSQQDPEYLTCQYALATLNRIVTQCNEGARCKERENEMRKIVTQLEYAKGVPPLEIIVENRWLIRSGVVTHMQQRNDENKLTFGKRFTKVVLHLFLFNDMLLVTKPKSENSYTVIHYCPRNLVELNSPDSSVSLPTKDTQGRHLLFLTILENQNEKTIEFLLSCSSESDKQRWIEAFTPPKSENPDETLYECWDCPQVTAIHNFSASQPDELALSRGDVINVLKKMADGWYLGERIRDGETGWFPANYCTEVANPHVRARNLKQRYRLLAFSENYLKTK